MAAVWFELPVYMQFR